ncbi:MULTISPECIES: RHS repeat domain-containing protein, partial [unclassified Neisseria]|uniref:RHS repeat domain-containing protein n=1 Tax=unclassified Neisseria TaxID=2623750 RepID=UPI002665D535
GTTHFEYDKLGRITQAGDERFAFDPAHNILSTNGQTVSDGLNPVTDNRIKHYNGTSYYYDDLGNLIHRELPNGEVQNYFYDLHDQLVKVEIFKKDGSKETWAYRYDALGRRIGKGRLKEDCEAETLSDGLADEREFIWDGSHLLQEVYGSGSGRYTYIYTDVGSYEPLAQIHNYTNEEVETYQEINYFHCDQIGIPREMTDKDGKLLWFGDYFGWGKLKSETNITNALQPFRLQNQYCDAETGLHYNFFRYYEPECGRFVNQDPIRLWGGDNFYQFANNVINWTDPSGLSCKPRTPKEQQDIAVRELQKLRATILSKMTKSQAKKNGIKVINVIVPPVGDPIIGLQPVHLQDVDKSVQDLYNSVPAEKRGNGHGRCAEVCTLDKGKDENLEGSVSVAMRVNDGMYMPACGSCSRVLDELGIIDGVAEMGKLAKL